MRAPHRLGQARTRRPRSLPRSQQRSVPPSQKSLTPRGLLQVVQHGPCLRLSHGQPRRRRFVRSVQPRHQCRPRRWAYRRWLEPSRRRRWARRPVPRSRPSPPARCARNATTLLSRRARLEPQQCRRGMRTGRLPPRAWRTGMMSATLHRRELTKTNYRTVKLLVSPFKARLRGRAPVRSLRAPLGPRGRAARGAHLRPRPRPVCSCSAVARAG
jgi:hypothetical protein